MMDRPRIRGMAPGLPSAKHKTGSPIHCLEQDTLQNVLSFLCPKQRAAAATCCRALRDAAASPLFWSHVQLHTWSHCRCCCCSRRGGKEAAAARKKAAACSGSFQAASGPRAGAEGAGAPQLLASILTSGKLQLSTLRLHAACEHAVDAPMSRQRLVPPSRQPVAEVAARYRPLLMWQRLTLQADDMVLLLDTLPNLQELSACISFNATPLSASTQATLAAWQASRRRLRLRVLKLWRAQRQCSPALTSGLPPPGLLEAIITASAASLSSLWLPRFEAASASTAVVSAGDAEALAGEAAAMEEGDGAQSDSDGEDDDTACTAGRLPSSACLSAAPAACAWPQHSPGCSAGAAAAQPYACRIARFVLSGRAPHLQSLALPWEEQLSGAFGPSSFDLGSDGNGNGSGDGGAPLLKELLLPAAWRLTDSDVCRITLQFPLLQALHINTGSMSSRALAMIASRCSQLRELRVCHVLRFATEGAAEAAEASRDSNEALPAEGEGREEVCVDGYTWAALGRLQHLRCLALEHRSRLQGHRRSFRLFRGAAQALEGVGAPPGAPSGAFPAMQAMSLREVALTEQQAAEVVGILERAQQRASEAAEEPKAAAAEQARRAAPETESQPAEAQPQPGRGSPDAHDNNSTASCMARASSGCSSGSCEGQQQTPCSSSKPAWEDAAPCSSGSAAGWGDILEQPCAGQELASQPWMEVASRGAAPALLLGGRSCPAHVTLPASAGIQLLKLMDVPQLLRISLLGRSLRQLELHINVWLVRLPARSSPDAATAAICLNLPSLLLLSLHVDDFRVQNPGGGLAADCGDQDRLWAGVVLPQLRVAYLQMAPGMLSPDGMRCGLLDRLLASSPQLEALHLGRPLHMVAGVLRRWSSDCIRTITWCTEGQELVTCPHSADPCSSDGGGGGGRATPVATPKPQAQFAAAGAAEPGAAPAAEVERDERPCSGGALRPRSATWYDMLPLRRVAGDLDNILPPPHFARRRCSADGAVRVALLHLNSGHIAFRRHGSGWPRPFGERVPGQEFRLSPGHSFRYRSMSSGQVLHMQHSFWQPSTDCS